VAGESARAFVPAPLPPDPPLRLEAAELDLLERANRALGRLDAVARIIPETSLFLYFYVRKEAVLSSQIEGTQSSLADLLLYESKQVPGVPVDDVEEVSAYVAALNHGLKRMQGGFPLSLRLLRELHAVLMRTGRGSNKQPGEFRRSQNWVGGSRPGTAVFVPPPPDKVLDLMSALEKFMHNEPTPTPTLIKAALAHVQFETIHPFLDGNGRIGRLLITLLLCAEAALSEPILYLSLYFKQWRDQYYERLERVRTEGDWEGWLQFFLTGVLETAEQAAETAQRIVALFDKDAQKIAALGKASSSALRLFHLMQKRPVMSLAVAAKQLKVSFPTAASGMANLEKLKIARETTGLERGKVFVYDRYLKLLQEGTEPIASR
jgi:Fic family protein